MVQQGFLVKGLNQTVRALQETGLEVDDLKDAFSELADEGARKAAEYAPKRKGTLSRDVRGNRAKSKAVVTAGRSSVPYAGPINYGWPVRNIRGSLFMQRASAYMEPVAIQRLEREINTTIRRKGLA